MKQKQKQKQRSKQSDGVALPQGGKQLAGAGRLLLDSVCCWHFNDADQMSSILISCLPTSGARWANPLQRVAHTPHWLEAVVSRCR